MHSELGFRLDSRLTTRLNTEVNSRLNRNVEIQLRAAIAKRLWRQFRFRLTQILNHKLQLNLAQDLKSEVKGGVTPLLTSRSKPEAMNESPFHTAILLSHRLLRT